MTRLLIAFYLLLFIISIACKQEDHVPEPLEVRNAKEKIIGTWKRDTIIQYINDSLVYLNADSVGRTMQLIFREDLTYSSFSNTTSHHGDYTIELIDMTIDSFLVLDLPYVGNDGRIWGAAYIIHHLDDQMMELWPDGSGISPSYIYKRQ